MERSQICMGSFARDLLIWSWILSSTTSATRQLTGGQAGGGTSHTPPSEVWLPRCRMRFPKFYLELGRPTSVCCASLTNHLCMDTSGSPKRLASGSIAELLILLQILVLS
jgi:hypothetical protein